jgi:hypothetical protein
MCGFLLFFAVVAFLLQLLVQSCTMLRCLVVQELALLRCLVLEASKAGCLQIRAVL